MKTIARTHTRKLRDIRALPLLAVAHFTDIADCPQRELSSADAAWAYYDQWDSANLYDHGDGSYSIGTRYHHVFDLFPAGHARHTAALNVLRRRKERAEQKRAAELAALEAERAAYVAPVQLVTPGMIPAASIVIHWSECGLFDDEQEFTGPACWAAVDAIAQQARAALIAEGRGGYDKTKFTVTFADGETYSGRWDIAANDHDGRTLHDHILHYIMVYAGKLQPAHWTAEEYAHRIEKDAAEFMRLLTTYRIGPVVKPRARYYGDGTRVLDVAPVIELTAAELLEVQSEARAHYAGIVPPDVLELCLARVSEQVTVTDHGGGAVWLDSLEESKPGRVLN